MSLVRRTTCLLVVSILLLPVVSVNASAEAAVPEIPDLGLIDLDPNDLVQGETVQLIVGHTDTVPPRLDPLAVLHGGRVLRTDPLLDFTVVAVDVDEEERFLQVAGMLRDVRYVVRDGPVEALFTPNDPLYGQQWGPPVIGVETVWNGTRGNHSIEVAVLDTGVDYTHPDLADNVCRLGPDFINEDDDPMDGHAHGTHVSGTVAAKIDNGVGVAGMADACIVPVKVLNDGGWGSWSSVASGIAWAADNGTDIISMSLGGCCAADPVTDAVQFAAQQGTLVIASAGNSGCGGDTVGYPAAYPEVIAVASVSAPGDQRSYFSSCGPAVEVSAPGHDIISTVPDFYDASGYAYASGTSMAAPHVAGVAALFWASHPTATAAEVRCILAQNTVDLLDPGRDLETGFGLIDAQAMFDTPSCVAQIPETPDLQARSGDLSAALQWTQPFAWGGVDHYNLYRGTDPETLTLIGNSTETRYVDSGLSAGVTYHYAVAAVNEAGESAPSAVVNVTVQAAQTLPQSNDLESGFGDWTATGAWELSTDRAASGQSALFNISSGESPATDLPATGTLDSPPIRLPDGAVSLRFWQHVDMWDWVSGHPVVEVATEDAPFSYERVWAMGGWIDHEGPAAVDLSGYAGEVVYLRFMGDSLLSDTREGWYVDDLSVVAEAAPIHDPLVNIVIPGADEISGGDFFAAGAYTDPNGDQDVVNVTYRLNGGPDQAAGVFGHYWLVNDGTLPSGTHDLFVTATDSAGNAATANVTFEVDGDPPTVEVTSPGPDQAVPCSFTLSGIARDAGAGLYYLYAFPASGSGESEERYPWHYVEFDGQSEAQWNLTMDTTMVPEGPFDVEITVADQAGNINETTWSLTRDGTDCRPQVTLSSPQPDAVLTCVLTVSGQASSPVGKELRWVDVYLDGERAGYDSLWSGNDFDIDIPLGREAPGAHNVTVVVYDEDWHSNQTQVRFFREDGDCLPQATITSPSEGTLADCRITISGTASTPNDGAEMYVDLFARDRYIGGSWVDSLGQWSAVARTGSLSPGSFSVRAEVHDDTGNWNVSAPLTLERSTFDCRPDISITSPDDGATAGCFLHVSGQVSSKSGVNIGWIDLVVDDRYWVGWTNVHAQSASWSAKARIGWLPEGEHSLTAIAGDYDGNWNVSAPVSFTKLDLDCAPKLEVLTPSDGETVSGNIVISGNVTFPENGEGEVYAYIPGTDWDAYEHGGSRSWSFSWNTYHVENGAYTLVVTSYMDGGGWTEQLVEVIVENERNARIEVDEQAGQIGCSVGWMPFSTADFCGEGGDHSSTVDLGLTSGRIVLTWNEDMPAGIDTLALGVSVGTSHHRAVADPGEGELVLEFHLDEPLIRSGDARISVRAAGGSASPTVALDEDYELDITWAYWGAELPNPA